MQGKALCGVWRVWLDGQHHNDFEHMHQCGKCYDVIRAEENAEEFFGRDAIRGRR